MTDSPISSVTVVGWDLGHNPAGRAWLLADMLREWCTVELVGPLFERYGTEVWKPVAHTRVPTRAIPGRMFPDFFTDAEELAATITSDVVWCSKSRLPSMLIGALAKERHGIPMVQDVDDEELAFFGDAEATSVHAAIERRSEPDFEIPFEKVWTPVAAGVATAADANTVSNPCLQARYGGQWVPHARDETVFDPARFDRVAVRRSIGLDAHHKVVFFGGTPRRHKGIVELAEAVAGLRDPDARLMLFGTRELREMEDDLAPYRDLLTVLPYRPLDELPALLAASDLCCVLQDPDSRISRYQIPAKLTDAMSMGVPVLVTPTDPVQPMLGIPGFHPVTPSTVGTALATAFEDLGDTSISASMRDAFLDDYSYRAHRPRLLELFAGLAADTPPMAAPMTELVDTTRSLFGDGRTTSVERHREPVGGGRRRRRRRGVDAADGYDVVLFWKQNDTGIYGRRHDMLVRYLARSPRVHRIVQFDRPIDPLALGRPLLHRNDADQSGLVARNTLRRMVGRANESKLSRHTFLQRPPDHVSKSRLFRFLPPSADYPAYVLSTLAELGVGRGHPLVLWSYPTSFEFPQIRDAIEADLIVADVVDDQRTWIDPTRDYYRRLTDNYADILDDADVILANCDEAAERMLEFTADITVVPNAAEPPTVNGSVGPIPRDLAAIPAPRLGYVGNLSDRIDIELLHHMASSRPEWNLVLIGSAHRDRAIMQLDALPNVHFLGVRQYEEAKQLMRHFDVGLIPHVDNEMTRAMHPLKAFVYASQGVPVVATGIGNLSELGSLIKVGRSWDEFMTLIDQTLAEPREPGRVSDDARGVLEPHTWPARVDAILDLLDAALTSDTVTTHG